jgi:anti-sigma-K factor RskA
MTFSEPRESARELIPLYVNGALRGPDRMQFELRLKHDGALRDELQEFEAIEAAFRETEADAAIDLEAVFRKVSARVAQEAPRRGPFYGRRAIGDLISARFAGWAVAAVQLAIFAVLFVSPAQRSDVLQTLSDEATTPVAATRVYVVFTEAATQEQMSLLLRRVHAQISGGPNEVGAFTLEVRNTQADPAQVIATLRSSEIVQFAELAY